MNDAQRSPSATVSELLVQIHRPGYASALFVLPPLVILCKLSWICTEFGEQPAMARMLYGVKPAETAIVAFAAYRIGSRTLSFDGIPVIAASATAGLRLSFRI